MVLPVYRIALCALLAGVSLSACGVQTREGSAEKKYVRICVQYIDAKYENAEALCRCQWDGIRAEVPKKDREEFFFKLTAGRRFETKASRMVDRIAAECLEKLGPRPVD